MEFEQEDLSQSYKSVRSMTDEERKAELVTLLKRKRDLLLQEQAGEDEVKQSSTEAGASYLGETGRAIGDGVFEAFNDSVKLVGELGNWANDNILDLDEAVGRAGILLPGDDRTGASVLFDLGGFAPAYLSPAEVNRRKEEGSLEGLEATDVFNNIVPEPKTAIGQAGKSITSFVAGFAMFNKQLRGTKLLTKAPLAKGMVAGALTDFTVFDGQERNLSNLLVELGSDTDNPAAILAKNAITEYLANDEDTGPLEGRLHTALEGLFLGGAVDGAMKVFRAIKAKRAAQRRASIAAKEVGDEVEIKLIKEDTPQVSSGDQVGAPQSSPTKTTEAAPKDTPQVPSEAVDETLAPTPTISISKDKVKAFKEALEDGDIKQTQELVDFNHTTYDWDKIADGQGVRDLLNSTSRHFADEIQSAGANVVVSQKTTARVANLVGQSAEVVHSVHKDVAGGHGLSARMLAAEKVMISSAERLKTLAQRVKDQGDGPGEEYLRELYEHIQVHAAIQAEVRGAKAEVGRAMHAMRIMKESAGEFKEIELPTQTSNSVDLVAAILKPKSLGELNETVRGFSSLKPFDIVTEVAINGLLSSLKTHTLNITSNALNVGFGVGSRWGAAAFGAIRRQFGAKNVTEFDEALAYTQGTLEGIREGIGIAWQAIKTRGPVTDPVQRLEFMNRRAIHIDTDTIKQWELDGNHGSKFLAKGMNVLGEIIRLPGTALVAGDEFFKATARRGQLHALATREANSVAQMAVDSGAKSYKKVYQKTYEELLKSPTKEMTDEAILFARKQTFQEAPGEFGKILEKGANHFPVVKLFIFPFVRTPLNLVRQAALDNSFFGVASKQVRRTIRKGGPEADLAIARMTLGGTMMLSVIPLWESGSIVGARGGYANSEAMDHIEPYSIKVPGTETWVSYDRADPFGMMLGLTADFMAALEADYDPSDPEYEDRYMRMAGGMLASLNNNILSETWMQSASELFELMRSRDNKSIDQWRKFLTKRSTMLVPFGSMSRAITGTIDPVSRDTDPTDFWSHFDKMMPWASSDLPPKRDYLGRTIVRSPSKQSVWNPYVTSEKSDDPLDNYMSSLAFEFTLPSRKKDGVRLTAAQYSRWGEIMSTLGGGSLEQTLRKLIADKNFTSLPRDTQIGKVKDVVSLFRSQALEMLKAEDRELAGKLEWAYRYPRLKQGGVHDKDIPALKEDFFKQFK